MPALIAPSPMTAMTSRRSPLKSRATAMPSPAEIEVELCAAPNGSYSLSDRLVKPLSPPPGQNLVRVGLMPDIPDQPVLRGVEHIVDGDGQLDDAEPGAEMPAGDRYRVDQFGAQLVGKLAQIRFRQFPQIRRRRAAIEQRRPVRDQGARLSVQGPILTFG